MSNNRSPGRHRRIRRTLGVTTFLGTATAAAAIAVAGPAGADPGQPGLTSQGAGQPGLTSPESGMNGGGQPGLTTAAPEPAPEPRTYWTPPPAEYDHVEWRQAPSYEAPAHDSGNGGGTVGYIEPTYIPPVRVEELHLPTYVEPVAPIEAPPERLRIGDYVADKPNWLSDEYLDRTNNTSAVIEAQMATFWQSIGVDVERSDRIAAATVGGTALGAASAAIPAATVGGLVGGTIGGIQGAAVGGMLPVPIPGVPEVTTGVAGTAAGAAIGAAVAGVPAAVVGGVAGGITGATFGAGDTTGTPTEMAIPNLPDPDPTTVTTQVSEQLAGQAPETVQAVAETVAAAPQVAENVTAQAVAAREAVLAQPGGDQVIGALDAAATEAGYAFGPTAEIVGAALGAATAGVPAAPAQ